MIEFDLIATATFGLESLVASELKQMGIENLKVENSRVCFKGDYSTIARTNIWLRCADRVLIQMARFKATDFEELFQGTLAVEWGDIIPENGKMHITGKSVRSKLFSVPDCQSIVKKAVIESMKRKYTDTVFSEDGPVYKIEVALINDIVTLTLDTSGKGLHKRGYRTQQGEAPIKETLAAALVYLSKWRSNRMLVDPLCGSGTIPIEAALMGRNIAPGINREFVSQTWPGMPKEVWVKAFQEAKDAILDIDLEIFASDSDKYVFKAAVENAEKAGVGDNIVFQKKPLQEFSSKNKYGCIICNPPYGERMHELSEVKALARDMGKTFLELEDWSFFIITAFDEFEKYFGKKSTKNRKLYNGKIKTYLYQYWGPFPPRKSV